MDFTLNDDELALRDGMRALMEGRFDIDRVRAGFTREMWTELGAAGVFSLAGDGFGWDATVIVFEELGAALVPGPIVGTFLAAGVDTAAAAGARVIGILERDDTPVVIEHPGDVDALLVLDDDGIVLVSPASLELTPSDWPLDVLTPVALAAALPAGERIGDAADAGAWRRHGALLTAALQVGLARRCLELAVPYAKEREQFGQPIGKFQAVKHMLADMAVAVELARASLHAAAVFCDDPASGPADVAVAAAKALAGEAARGNGKRATQVHGGMGFTWEVDVHLLLKRAWVLETHFGDSDHQADIVACALPAPR